jgi:tetratricopeptide (TPR) repeat protein
MAQAPAQAGNAGRNDPCPCGSGRKYKKCCGASKPPAVPAAAQDGQFDAAAGLFEAGRHDEAGRLCEAILARQPDHAGALHLLGLTHYQRGGLDDARTLIQRAVDREPDNAWAHNSLCLVHHAQGRLDEAYRHCQRALQLDPGLGAAHNNLGNLYKDANRLQEAEAAYRQALACEAGDPNVHCNLGLVLHMQNRWEEAIACYEQALALAPDFPAAHNNLGAAHQRLKDYEAALRHYRRAQELGGENAESLNNIAAALREQGELTEARRHLERAIALDPDYAGAYANLANLRGAEGDPDEARRLYEKALSLDPALETAHVQLAGLLAGKNDFDAARAHYHEALRANPHSVPAYAGLAALMQQQENWPEAQRYYEEALGRDPRHAGARVGLAAVLQARHRMSEARAELDKAVAADRTDPAASIELAGLHAFQGDYDAAVTLYRDVLHKWPDDEAGYIAWAATEEKRHNLEQAESLLRRALALSGPEADAVRLLLARVLQRRKRHAEAEAELASIEIADTDETPFASSYFFEKAQLLDRQGRHTEAFLAAARANAIKARTRNLKLKREEVQKGFARFREVESRELLAALPRAGLAAGRPQPIFIVGFPRSGTTLLEQILVSHPNIAAGDELVFVSDLTQAMPRLLGTSEAFPECLRALGGERGREHVDRLRDYYLDRVAAAGLDIAGRGRFTDKMPLNIKHLPLISLLFPESPILHIIRNPLDTCVSAFFANFTHGNSYALNIDDAAFFYAQVAELAEYYVSIMPMKYMALRYEDLVTDQEAMTRKVIEFVGEPWDERCLAFHETRRVSRTASYAQVTEKIYTSSLARYRRYAEHLDGALAILRPTMERLGYL